METLSGGELFLASLSLAFGLSDVVQSYSGGVHLDSLFIDEGFGSLDQETLDTAMKALAQLQHMGRTIGIISHVSELKTASQRRLLLGKTGTAAVRSGFEPHKFVYSNRKSPGVLMDGSLGIAFSWIKTAGMADGSAMEFA